MIKNSFWGLIWSSFQEIQGFWIGFLGVFITIILSRFPVKTPIPLDVVIIIGFFILLFIATLLKAVDKSFKEYQKIKRRIVPRILVVKKEQSTGSIICLLEYSELFAYDMYISFYYTDDRGFENLIGVGFINTIQSNDKIQAIFDQPILAHQDICDKLANNDVQILAKTVVKPGYPRSFNQP